MTPLESLFELLERVGTNRGAVTLVSDEELYQWPEAAVKAMKSQKLIAKARHATSAICPGCERDCVMPVHTVMAGKPSSFIVCDKRSDINRVPVPAARLLQWQCNGVLVSRFVASCLDLSHVARQADTVGRWGIGIVLGNKRSQMICLEASGTLDLVAGSNKVPLVEFIGFHDGRYSVNAEQVRRLADAATTADERYTPSNARREARKLDTQATHESWRKAYRQKKKERPGMSDSWYAQQIAKMDIGEGRSADTIRKQMKK